MAFANYSLTNLFVICLVGLVVKYFFSSKPSASGDTGPATSTIWGYGISALAIFFMAFINYSMFVNKTKLNKDSMSFAGGFMNSTVPSFLTLILLLYMIYLNLTYFKIINQGKVPDEYYTMSNMSTVLVFFQVFTLFKYIMSVHNAVTSNKSSDIADTAASNGSILYLLTLINVIFIIIINIILKYFITDD